MKQILKALGLAALLAMGGCGDPPSGGRATLPPGIGDVQAVVRVVHGTLANHDTRRVLSVKDDVYWRELIETEQASATEVEFVDGTRLTVGPDAKVNLDEFVYGGPPGTDRMVMTVTKGMSRFVTGSMDKAAYEIRAPGSIIGVRGTEFTLIVDPDEGTTLCIVHQGEVEIKRPDGGQGVIVHPGEASKASARPDRGITPAVPSPPEVIKTAETLRAVVDAAKVEKSASATSKPVTDADRRVAALESRDEFGRDRLQELAERLRSIGSERDGGHAAASAPQQKVAVQAASTAKSVAAAIGASVATKTGASEESTSKVSQSKVETASVATKPAAASSQSSSDPAASKSMTDEAAAKSSSEAKVAVPVMETSTTSQAASPSSNGESSDCKSAECVAVPIQSIRESPTASQTHIRG